MRQILVTVSLVSAIIMYEESVFAYDIPNHFDMSKEAAVRSILNTDPSTLINLGLMSLDQRFSATNGENSSEFTDGCKHNEKFSITNLIACGAQFEDVPGTRSFNHFYDSINNSPLTVLGIKPGSVPDVPNMISPDWALKDNNDEPAQEFSYKDARMAQIVASYSPPLAGSSSPEMGEYVISRIIDGVKQVFFIYFLRGEDGVWRLDSRWGSNEKSRIPVIACAGVTSPGLCDEIFC